MRGIVGLNLACSAFLLGFRAPAHRSLAAEMPRSHSGGVTPQASSRFSEP